MRTKVKKSEPKGWEWLVGLYGAAFVGVVTGGSLALLAVCIGCIVMVAVTTGIYD